MRKSRRMPVLSFVSAMIKPGEEIRVAVNWAIEHEFRGVEISARAFSADPLNDEEIDWLVARAAEHGITYTIHFPLDAAPASHHTERWLGWLEQMKQTIVMAGRVDCPVIVLHPGVIDCPGIEPENATESLRKDAVDNLLRFLGEVEPLAQNAGTVICLENMHHREGDVVRSYQQLIDVVDIIDSPAVRITLDVGHAFIHDGLPEAVEAFGNRVYHVHLDDALDGKDHMEIGTGELDMELYAEILEPGRVRVATMEVGGGPDGDFEGAQLRSRDALKTRFGDLLT